MRASELARDFGTPLVVYCRDSVLARARAYARVEPDALVVYGTKAFPNVALLRLLAAEGLGADVSTLGELCFALRGGVPDDRLVFHGNNKSDAELRAAAGAGALVVLDALEEIGRAKEAGVARVLVRLTTPTSYSVMPACPISDRPGSRISRAGCVHRARRCSTSSHANAVGSGTTSSSE